MKSEVNNIDSRAFLEAKIELQEALLKYFDDNSNQENNLKSLMEIIDKNKIRESRPELYILLHSISNISMNHYRAANFSTKIEKILLLFSQEIKQSFSNSKIFDIFKENKQIILFLIENEIIEPTKELYHIISQEKYQKKFYQHYFFNEFQTFYDESTRKKIEKELETQEIKNFDKCRKIGQNETEVCQLIRNDSIDEIISMINQNKTKYSSTINQSIFETNSFLIDKNPTLIEYAAFFGSINIFKYLVSKKVTISPNIWLYAIHGNNLEIIQIIQKNRIYPSDLTYKECFIESIKCFHHEIAELIKNKLNKVVIDLILIKCLKYCNYLYFPSQKLFDSDTLFYNLCKYNYVYFVDLLCNSEKIDFLIKEKKQLIIAAEKENVEIVACLLNNTKINVNDQLIFKLFIVLITFCFLF